MISKVDMEGGLVMETKDELDGLNGVYKQMATLIGIDNCLAIYKEFKGITITFPTKLIDSEFVKKQIAMDIDAGKEYTGKEIKKVAHYYDYSERQIRRYIKQIKDDYELVVTIEDSDIPYITDWLHKYQETED